MNTTSLSAWRARFLTLAAPAPASIPGFRRVDFVGPFWLRGSAPSAIALGGLPGWLGKRFISDTQAINVLKGGEERLPMQVELTASWLDGKPVLVCHYGSESPFPWRRVRDEFRELSETTWLGMTMIDLPGLRRVGWPFLLTRVC
jgi:hypothetical protein